MALAKIGNRNYTTEVSVRDFAFLVDEPLEEGGGNLGPKPTEILDAALASCTVITLRMYAERKDWDLGDLQVKVEREKEETETKFVIVISSSASLNEEQKTRLLLIAHKCPVHKLLSQNKMEVRWG
ncbi:OsmC family protein [Elizabethkingia sp. JS20170427COW]|uniref:OsmC family protein n=1 Tax=Elizabethkingia sp. JS20170427COW TaxID=2583851 RepID=UPI001110E1E6|nr:OsmC family protein [Elizabethkingia sp. JS20170427COW]QCX53287.1 OsmC family protein [Elizabethkingia sp. JS20170427COW]